MRPTIRLTTDDWSAEPGPAEALRLALDARDSERRRISRDLHDMVGQAMITVRLSLAAAREAAATDRSRHLIEEGIAAVDRALVDVRRLAADLRSPPLLEVGLVDAIDACLAAQSRLTGWQAAFEFDPLDEPLPPALEAACYGIVQEALTNVARHAQARSVSVSLRVQPRWIEVAVADDGVGFEPRTLIDGDGWRGLGLMGMAERVGIHGGSLVVTSEPGRGATVRARFARSGWRRPMRRPLGRLD